MTNLQPVAARAPLVLLVDPVVTTRHWMWRGLTRAFGVLEAGTAEGARDWLSQRPDIDALVIEDELPDQRGTELVRDLAVAGHPIVPRSIVLAAPGGEWAWLAQAGAALVERGDLRGVITRLAGWFLTRDARLARTLLREAERLSS